MSKQQDFRNKMASLLKDRENYYKKVQEQAELDYGRDIISSDTYTDKFSNAQRVRYALGPVENLISDADNAKEALTMIKKRMLDLDFFEENDIYWALQDAEDILKKNFNVGVEPKSKEGSLKQAVDQDQAIKNHELPDDEEIDSNDEYWGQFR